MLRGTKTRMMGNCAILFENSKKDRFTILHSIITTKKHLCFGKTMFEPFSNIKNKFMEVHIDFVKDKVMHIEINHSQN